MVPIFTTILVMAGERIDKTERLLNLTLALLATRRPMSKNEIFSNIPGYSGRPDAMERMFERDKDELREIGIEIQVLPLDSYFDDELGYQIISKDFFLPEIKISHEEAIWLAVANSLLAHSSNSLKGDSALQKIYSANQISINDVLQFSQTWDLAVSLDETLLMIWESIREQVNLAFVYGYGPATGPREVSPYTIISRHGNWYVVARDLNDERIKTFRVDRISELSSTRVRKFVPPISSTEIGDFLASFNGKVIPKITIRLHKELSLMHPIFMKSQRYGEETSLPSGSLIDLIELDKEEALEMILRAGDSIEVVEPIDLRIEIIDRLQSIVKAHS